MASVIPHDEETTLVSRELSLQPPKSMSHTKGIRILSLALLLIFLAYGVAQNLQNTLYKTFEPSQNL
ncbi:hypothetical protein SESBI_07928 [Sesbania bispinosa]|nr:hypothetical protein SESBI_07928 [Sesbania bispinosa]